MQWHDSPTVFQKERTSFKSRSFTSWSFTARNFSELNDKLIQGVAVTNSN